jgi:hypothetical protein
MSNDTNQQALITRREAVQRVTALLGGIALVGGSSLMAACNRENAAGGRDTVAAAGKTSLFNQEEIAFLDEVADTILPTTQKSPGAKAAKTGAFMALMATDTYSKKQQDAFKAGLKAIDDASTQMHKVGFMAATPAQRLAVLTELDKQAKAAMDERSKQGSEEDKKKAAELADKRLSDQRQERAPSAEAGAGGATAVTQDAAEEEPEPPHYFRMMKELSMLGYFTSEIGYTKAMRYVETPGRYDGCAPYTAGETSWAPHA